MDAESIIDEIGDEQGWDDSSKLAVALRYIDSQQSPGAFEDFVREQASEENEAAAEEQRRDEKRGTYPDRWDDAN